MQLLSQGLTYIPVIEIALAFLFGVLFGVGLIAMLDGRD